MRYNKNVYFFTVCDCLLVLPVVSQADHFKIDQRMMIW